MSLTIELPVLPLRDIVAFPLMTRPLLAGRAKSVQACAAALRGDRRILLVAQRNPAVEDPQAEDLFGLGTIAVLVEHLTLPESRMKLLVRGERRARIVSLNDRGAIAEPVEDSDAAPTPADPRSFSLADWNLEGLAGANRVAALQRILEDETLGPAERLRAASQRLGD